MPPGIRPAFVRGGYSAYLVCAVVFRLERMWDLTFYLLRAMQCITNFFQRVPEAGGPWLWKVPRLFEPRIASHEEAKHVGGSERAHTAALAADSLNTLTGRGAGGDRWRPMSRQDREVDGQSLRQLHSCRPGSSHSGSAENKGRR